MRTHVWERGNLGSFLAGLPQGKWAWRAFSALLLLLAPLHLFTLLRTPAPFVDDAWYASRAWSLIQSGQAFGALDAGVLDRFDGYWTYFPWLGPWFQSLVIRALGLSLFSVRLTSLIFGLGLLALVYAIALRLSGPVEGLLAVLLTGLSRPFLQSAHLGRPDIMAAALGYGAVALYLAGDGRRLPVRGALAGLLVGLAFELHPNAMIYGPAIVALCWLDHGRRVLRAGQLWGFVAGVGVGLLIYVATHILRYPETYFAVTRIIVGSSRVPPLFTGDLGEWQASLHDAGYLLTWAGGLRAPLAVAGAVVLARRGPSGGRRLAVLFAALALAFIALVSNKASYYAILVAPAADLLVATFVARLLARREAAPVRSAICNMVARGVLVAMSLSLLVGSLPHGISQLDSDPMPDYRIAVEAIRQAVPPGRSILGSQTYWLDLPDRGYQSWENLVYYLHDRPGSTVAEALEALHPDFLVIDGYVEQLIADDTEQLPAYHRFVSVPRGDLNRALDRRGHLVDTVRTDAFGDVRVYRIDWE